MWYLLATEPRGVGGQRGLACRQAHEPRDKSFVINSWLWLVYLSDWLLDWIIIWIYQLVGSIHRPLVKSLLDLLLHYFCYYLVVVFVLPSCLVSLSRVVCLSCYSCGLNLCGCVNHTRITNLIGGLLHPIRLGKTHISHFDILINLSSIFVENFIRLFTPL
jgi:hypothetical protein